MKLSLLLRLNAILYVIFGIAFALYSPLMLAFFGILENEGSAELYWYAISFARMFGAVLFGFGFVIWAISPSVSADLGRKIVAAFILAHLTALVVALTQQASIWGMLAGWIMVGVLLALFAGYMMIFSRKSWD